jgi:hypothetical protein
MPRMSTPAPINSNHSQKFIRDPSARDQSDFANCKPTKTSTTSHALTIAMSKKIIVASSECVVGDSIVALPASPSVPRVYEQSHDRGHKQPADHDYPPHGSLSSLVSDQRKTRLCPWCGPLGQAQRVARPCAPRTPPAQPASIRSSHTTSDKRYTSQPMTRAPRFREIKAPITNDLLLSRLSLLKKGRRDEPKTWTITASTPAYATPHLLMRPHPREVHQLSRDHASREPRPAPTLPRLLLRDAVMRLN